MPNYVVLDTDVASLSFRDRLTSPMSTLLASRITCVTFVTIGEMTKWAELRDWSPRNRQRLDLARQPKIQSLPVAWTPVAKLSPFGHLADRDEGDACDPAGQQRRHGRCQPVPEAQRGDVGVQDDIVGHRLRQVGAPRGVGIRQELVQFLVGV